MFHFHCNIIAHLVKHSKRQRKKCYYPLMGLISSISTLSYGGIFAENATQCRGLAVMGRAAFRRTLIINNIDSDWVNHWLIWSVATWWKMDSKQNCSTWTMFNEHIQVVYLSKSDQSQIYQMMWIQSHLSQSGLIFI